MAFDELCSSCMPQLYHAASRVLHNPEDAEDAVQEGLFSAFRHFDQFEGRSKFSTWLCSIVTNAARMKLRKESHSRLISLNEEGLFEQESWLEQMLTDDSPNPEQVSLREERHRILLEAMRDLPESSREVIQLCYFHGFLDREAAQQLGLPVATLKARRYRAACFLHERVVRIVSQRNRAVERRTEEVVAAK